jgi:hypothetical protein
MTTRSQIADDQRGQLLDGGPPGSTIARQSPTNIYWARTLGPSRNQWAHTQIMPDH